MQSFTAVRVPDLAMCGDAERIRMNQPDDLLLSVDWNLAYAEKSALPVAARDVSSEILLLQTAPLCPAIKTQHTSAKYPLKSENRQVGDYREKFRPSLLANYGAWGFHPYRPR